MNFNEEQNMGIKDSHLIKLMANDWKKWIGLLNCELSLIAVIFIFLLLLSCFFVFVMFLLFSLYSELIPVLFGIFYLLKLNFTHIFLIIIIIDRSSGMCHVPAWFDRWPSSNVKITCYLHV